MWTPIEIFNLVWAQLWQVTVVAVIVSCVTYLAKAWRWHPAIANSLWLLVLAKALTPPLWASPFGIFSWTEAQPLINESRQAATATSTATTGWLSVCAIVWVLGVVAVLACHWARWRQLKATIEAHRLPTDADLANRIVAFARRLGIRHTPPVIVTSAELGPALVGLRNPTIVLPDSLVRAAKWDELEPIVAHELLHLQRRDTAVSVLQLLANAIWWFYPVVRWAGNQVEEASERCVDLAVLHVAGCKPSNYCRSLLRVLESRVAHSQCLLIAAPGVRGVSVTTERIRELSDVPSQPGRWQRVSRMVVAGFLGLVLLPGLPLDVLQPKCCTSDGISYEPTLLNKVVLEQSESKTDLRKG